VPIDQLPQTWPKELFLYLLLASILAYFFQKKLLKGA
jgi:hypothetical protein